MRATTTILLGNDCAYIPLLIVIDTSLGCAQVDEEPPVKANTTILLG